MKPGTKNIFFIPKNQVPAGQKVTYNNTVCYCRPLKDDPYRVRITIGGNILIYLGDPRISAASLLDSKLISNSTVSTPGARLFCVDIKYYFMNNPMSHFEYMKVLLQ